MTRDQILAEPAGRELDALVAVRVMGWRYGKSVNKGHNYECVLVRPQEVAGWLPEYVSDVPFGRPLYPSKMPAYSEDIAAAWAVVEKLTLSLLHGKDDKGERKYGVYLWDQASNCNTFIADAGTAPLAICRAALLATLKPSGDPT